MPPVMETVFYLMRHAEADYSRPMDWKTQGWGLDMAPLTARGRLQAADCITRALHLQPQFLLCSPTTRTLETALHILPRLRVSFAVEFDLHEWVPDKEFTWRGWTEVEMLLQNFDAAGGEAAPGTTPPWETLSEIRARALPVLRRHAQQERVLVVCHSMLIRALTGHADVRHTEIVPYTLDPGSGDPA